MVDRFKEKDIRRDWVLDEGQEVEDVGTVRAIMEGILRFWRAIKNQDLPQAQLMQISPDLLRSGSVKKSPLILGDFPCK